MVQKNNLFYFIFFFRNFKPSYDSRIASVFSVMLVLLPLRCHHPNQTERMRQQTNKNDNQTGDKEERERVRVNVSGGDDVRESKRVWKREERKKKQHRPSCNIMFINMTCNMLSRTYVVINMGCSLHSTDISRQ